MLTPTAMCDCPCHKINHLKNDNKKLPYYSSVGKNIGTPCPSIDDDIVIKNTSEVFFLKLKEWRDKNNFNFDDKLLYTISEKSCLSLRYFSERFPIILLRCWKKYFVIDNDLLSFCENIYLWRVDEWIKIRKQWVKENSVKCPFKIGDYVIVSFGKQKFGYGDVSEIDHNTCRIVVQYYVDLEDGQISDQEARTNPPEWFVCFEKCKIAIRYDD